MDLLAWAECLFHCYWPYIAVVAVGIAVGEYLCRR